MPASSHRRLRPKARRDCLGASPELAPAQHQALVEACCHRRVVRRHDEQRAAVARTPGT